MRMKERGQNEGEANTRQGKAHEARKGGIEQTDFKGVRKNEGKE